MTYHMERTHAMWRGMRGGYNSGHRHSFSSESSSISDFSKKIRFPQKLFEVMNNESDLITWNYEGNGILVNVDDFETRVMQTHPGLVQISTFPNFRRQLRWYGFDWEALDREGNFEFKNPNFIRDHPELLDKITTRKYGSGTFCQNNTSLSRSHFSPPAVSKPKLPSVRGVKSRGRRGRPRKQRSDESASYKPPPSAVSSSPKYSHNTDSELQLDENELDRVTEALSQREMIKDEMSEIGSESSFPLSYSAWRGCAPGSKRRCMSTRGRCLCYDQNHNHCCHCCCHCCCCNRDEEFWHYCRPWMPYDQYSGHGVNPYRSQEANYNDLSYYDQLYSDNNESYLLHNEAPETPSSGLIPIQHDYSIENSIQTLEAEHERNKLVLATL